MSQAADPTEDGWMVFDFMCAHEILQGTSEVEQKWLHRLDLSALVNKHAEYVHGSPYQEKKVVLDEDILNRM